MTMNTENCLCGMMVDVFADDDVANDDLKNGLMITTYINRSIIMNYIES